MKQIKKIISLLLIIPFILNNNFILSNAYAEISESNSEQEINADTIKNEKANSDEVNILNYLTVKTYELSERKEDYLELENIQNLIYNGVNINVLQDDDTHNFVVNDFLPTITKFKLDSKARVRVLEKYNEEKAKSITKGVLATSQAMTSIDTSNVAGAIVGGTGAAATGVSTTILALQNAESENNDLNFELDKNAINNIDNLKTKLLDYMIKLSKNSGIDDSDILREDDIKEFYKAKINTNIYNKIDKLNDTKKKLKNYGPYWLELSKAHYQKAIKDDSAEEYKKCIEAFEEYEKIGTKIYRNGKDLEKYEFIPAYLESIEKVKPNEYISVATKYANMLDNDLSINQDDWDIKYYLVALYEKLYTKSYTPSYLNKAYEIIRKLTVEVSTILKDNNENAYTKKYDETVGISIIKLKDIAEKLNKGENEYKSLDNQIFGENGLLFYNYFLDKAFSFSKNNKEKMQAEIDDIASKVYVTEDGSYISLNNKAYNEELSNANIVYDIPKAGWGTKDERL